MGISLAAVSARLLKKCTKLTLRIYLPSLLTITISDKHFTTASEIHGNREPTTQLNDLQLSDTITTLPAINETTEIKLARLEAENRELKAKLQNAQIEKELVHANNSTLVAGKEEMGIQLQEATDDRDVYEKKLKALTLVMAHQESINGPFREAAESWKKEAEGLESRVKRLGANIEGMRDDIYLLNTLLDLHAQLRQTTR
jgi:chromosome segregation ATPase